MSRPPGDCREEEHVRHQGCKTSTYFGYLTDEENMEQGIGAKVGLVQADRVIQLTQNPKFPRLCTSMNVFLHHIMTFRGLRLARGIRLGRFSSKRFSHASFPSQETDNLKKRSVGQQSGLNFSAVMNIDFGQDRRKASMYTQLVLPERLVDGPVGQD